MKTYTVKNHRGKEVKIPALGFGTAAIGEFMADNDHVYETILKALELGYRHLDTAAMYGNERSVGRAIRNSGLRREEIFLTSKIWPTQFGAEEAKKALEQSIERLGLDYIDLYLLHWPYPEKTKETWKSLESALEKNTIKLLGVSNFRNHDLEELFSYSDVKPVTNQIEFHPYFQQKEMEDFAIKHEIVVSAWSPLGTGSWSAVSQNKKPISDPVIKEIALKYDAEPAQVLVSWSLQNERIVLVKSETPKNMKANLKSEELHLSDEDIASINALARGSRLGADPSNALPDLLKMKVPN